MQNSDGGWGAFDHENNLQFLNHIPFADHNAMLDPSTADVTARAVECLGQMGWPAMHPVIERARAFLRHDQTADGSWFGRWGVNYVYGTSGVLRALETVGMASRDHCQKAANWLRSVQNPDGGFGESILVLLRLLAEGKREEHRFANRLGIDWACWRRPGRTIRRWNAPWSWLVSHQNPDGTWDEEEFTGTGFPCVFYLKYHLYRNSFPLYALARYDNMRKGRRKFIGVQVPAEEIQNRNGHWG